MLEKMLANIQKPTSELIIIRIFTQDNPSVHGGRKPECPEKTLEVSLRLTQTQSTYNVVVEVEGVTDVHYASLTSQGVQHRVFYLDGQLSRYQPRPTGLNFGEQTGTGVFPLVIAVPHKLIGILLSLQE